MNPPGVYPYAKPAGAETRMAWLLALVTSGLVIVAAALAFDLHNQKRRFENMTALLKDSYTLREAESKTTSARYATAEAALQRVRKLASEEESDLKKLDEACAQREPLVKQSIEVQDKLTTLAKDLLDLAKIDPEAKEIAHKYNLQQ